MEDLRIFLITIDCIGHKKLLLLLVGQYVLSLYEDLNSSWMCKVFHKSYKHIASFPSLCASIGECEEHLRLHMSFHKCDTLSNEMEH